MAVTRYKVGALEVGSVEQAFTTEVPLDAPNVFFNASGFVADNISDAIVEAKATAAAASRYVINAAFDGSAGSGRWLEFAANVPSNTSPFIVPETSILVALSLVGASATQTATATVFKNGAVVQTVALIAAKKNRVTGLNITLAPLDELSIQVTAGTVSKPLINLFIRTST